VALIIPKSVGGEWKMTPIKIKVGKERSVVVEPNSTFSKELPRGISLVVSDKDNDPDSWWVRAEETDGGAEMQEIWVDEGSPSGSFYPTKGIFVRAKYISEKK